MKKNTKLWKHILFWSVGFLLVIFIVFGILIGSEVEEVCQSAREKYKRDCVGALIFLLEDEKTPLVKET